MCNIWKNKKVHELTVDELYAVMIDSLYSDIVHVGISGGEPTLRKDLSEIVSCVIKVLPTLHGISVITNAVNSRRTISVIDRVISVCKESRIALSVMVSLDGIGEVHDTSRGKQGGFSSAEKVIAHLKKNSNISLSVGCTITKSNVWDLDEFLDYAKANDLVARFRVAEFINRLSNYDRSEFIRNFDGDELYQLRLFFMKLIYQYEPLNEVKRTYKNIFLMLGGGARITGCPYRSDAILLNSEGYLAYCAPKSSLLGSGLDNSSLNIYKNNLKERRRIINEDCSGCIHDYYSEVTFKEWLNEQVDLLSDWLLNIDSWKYVGKIVPLLRGGKLYETGGSKKKVLIVGWYGTETVGDKAILGQIFREYREESGGCVEFCLGSLNPFLSEITCKELGVNASVIDAKSIDLLRAAKYADEVVMGGGPLMHLEELYIPLLCFSTAKKYKNKTKIYGCGIGPLDGDGYITTVKNILMLSDTIYLRDSQSVEYAKFLTGRADICQVDDPARNYILQSQPRKLGRKKNELACYLREWPAEYGGGLAIEEFISRRVRLERGLVLFIKKKAKELGVENIKFYHMHNFVHGSDDRDFSIRFIREWFSGDDEVSFDNRLSTVDGIVDSMKSAEYCVCMRFHSVLFAHALNVRYTAIDYTSGGKIYNYLYDHDELSRMVEINELISMGDA